MDRFLAAAQEAMEHCHWIAERSEDVGRTTRTFLSPPMHEVHAYLRTWMENCGLTVEVDAVGNLRGTTGKTRLIIASHLDTVPAAGAYDGVLGVVMAVSLVRLMQGSAVGVEVIGFSEEEGVRFGAPFIGSRALVGSVQEMLSLTDRQGITVAGAIRQYGLDPERIAEAEVGPQAKAYLEIHIEQGPVLESLDLPLGVVEAIAGQSRLDVTFSGQSNHAGTTPMALRRDALAGAAEWIQVVESEAQATAGLVATVGYLEAHPNVRNAINGRLVASLDVRHAQDHVRLAAVDSLLAQASRIGERRGLRVTSKTNLDQAAVPMDSGLVDLLAEAVSATGRTAHRMTSGAGHDAMIVAQRLPCAMLFLRSPGGISHHPDERVLVEDVAAGLEAGIEFLKGWEARNV